MPVLQITTNVTIENADVLAKQASSLAADILGKPESYVMVKILPEQTLILAGTNEPAAHVKLKSLGLQEDKTTDYSASLCAFISNNFGIDSARIYIEFANPQRHMWGWDNRTF